VWRWELGESGRDGATTIPEKVTVVSIVMMGRYRVDATINKENYLQRIHTWVPDPVLGDANYEHEFANADYVDIGSGIRYPTVWHHHDGWDDNFGSLNVSAGHNGFGGKFPKIEANACSGSTEVPPTVRQANFSASVQNTDAGRRHLFNGRALAQQRGDRVQGLHCRRGSAARRGRGTWQ
jgi:hypothetical protein